MRTALAYRTNRDLFSNHYLDERLPETEAWGEVGEDELRAAYDDIGDRWERKRRTAPKRNESRLEETFIRPTFRILGIPFEVEERTDRPQRRPDYGFFDSEEAARDASDRREAGGDFYRDAVAVADARRWGRPLDTRGSGERERDFENPSYWIHVHLQETPARWAVLTDGKTWRLYYAPTSHRLDSYYEIDLPTVLETGDLEDFKYFYLFFRHEAFLEDAGGESFLDDVYSGSTAFARELGEDLQDNVYDAIEVLAEGFLRYPDNDLDEDDIELIHDSSLVYLYRLIVVLYAESEGRDLLDTNNAVYEQSYSLNSLKREVAEELDSANPSYRDWQDNLHSRLDELFALVDQGSESCGIPEGYLYVPAYDGGLFRTDLDDADRREARFLANHTAGDACLATVIELLTRSERGIGSGTVFVDYSSLDVRHLGSIYEGLLEYDLDVADEQLALDDGEYVRAGDGDDVVAEEGEVYLTTDSGERKATGSYYTPEYVVEYIVENTLEPLVTEIREDLTGRGARGERGFAAAFAERVFDLKVLDPAMGSGHFLARAVDYLAREIIAAQAEQAAQEGIETVDRERDIDWARRQVAQRCIYGVDRNPLAVELAKVSLWLRTLAAERPLAFLDHHLKAGNSLVGSDIEEIEELESASGGGGRNATLADSGIAREGAIEQPMRLYREFLAIQNRELADVTEMEATYDAFERNTLRRRLTAMANVHTAREFGLDTLPDDAFERMAAALEADDAWKRLAGTQWFEGAQSWADVDRYFHWKLEYPDVFYDEDADRRDDPGFDAVVGNPPWVATAGRPTISASIDANLRSYLEDAFEATENQFDLYVAFYEQAVRQSNSGRVGIVVPDSILTREQNEPIRDFVLTNASLSRIVRVGTAFEGVETGAVVLVSGDSSSNVRCADATESDTLSALAYSSIPETVFEEQDAKRFLIHLDETTRSVLTTVEAHPSLEDRVNISRGEEIGKRAEFLSESSRSGTRPIAPGGAVVRYGIDVDELRHVERADVEKDESNYRSPKLVFRQTGDSLVGTYDEDDLITIKSAYNLRSTGNSPDELKHVLGVLNSPLLNFYHHYKHAAYRSVFPQINQSTFEAFPMAFDGSPDGALVEAVDDHLELTSRRLEIDPNIADYLGQYDDGRSLGELPESRPAEGVADTLLVATTEERPALKIGSVTVEERRNAVVLLASVRYKPDDTAIGTDRWGYAETEPLPALKFVDLGEESEALVKTFVPHAVSEGGGFANFRTAATKTMSPLDRLRALTLPRLDDVERELRRFAAQKTRAADLDRRISTVERTIHERVCSLYGIPDDERDAVRREFEDDRFRGR